MSAPLSEVTRYLDLPRWHDRRGHPSLDTDEVLEVRRLATVILAMPRGDRLRTQLFRQLADRFGVTTRTIYRYLLDDVRLVECEGFVALFRVPRRGGLRDR